MAEDKSSEPATSPAEDEPQTPPPEPEKPAPKIIMVKEGGEGRLVTKMSEKKKD